MASSSMLVNGQHANFVTAAETTMMLKEHIIETYGETASLSVKGLPAVRCFST